MCGVFLFFVCFTHCWNNIIINFKILLIYFNWLCHHHVRIMSLTYVLKDVKCRVQLGLVPVAHANGLYAQDDIPKIISAVDKLLTYLHEAINILINIIYSSLIRNCCGLSRLRKCWVCSVLSRVNRIKIFLIQLVIVWM